jgi:hypothetical protein
VSDLLLARRMGWTYHDVRSLPRDVYDVLVEELNRPPEADA